MDRITVVVPCYNEQESLPIFYKEITKVLNKMKDVEFEFMLIDDGSSDTTLSVMKSLAEHDCHVVYQSFSRNFGKEAAIYAGLKAATGNYAVIMDADLQDPPGLLPEMYQILKDGEYNSVATRRITRKGEPAIRSFFARRFYFIMNKLTQVELMDGARDYRLMDRQFINALLELGEYNRFSKGMFSWVRFKTKWLEFENVQRVAGETKWSFWKLFKYSLEGLVAFSTAPLSLASIAGIVSCIAAFLFMVIIILRRLLFGDPVAGWASIVTIILFLGGIQLFCIGILGQYLSKVYLETKKRPIYIVAETNIKSERKV
ncbi:MAG: glycosyltransferase family 2 protein [Tannerellaceae bacterium]|nr:glycosyltransferase family 2 protein [Tannerellaceae bacterium]